MRMFVLMAMAATLAASLPAPTARAENPNGDPITKYAAEDAGMGRAIADARASLPRVFAAFDDASSQGPADQFLFKVAMAATDGSGAGAEHIWVNGLRRAAGRWAGALANEPNHLEGLHAGSSVEFEERQISDWIMISADGMYGAYTIRFMLKDLDPVTAAEQRAMLTDAPLPNNWR